MIQFYRAMIGSALAGACVVATPAIAQQTAVTGDARLEGGASAPAKSEARAKPKRYCIEMEAATGSRMARRECRTRSEWISRGVDPAALADR